MRSLWNLAHEQRWLGLSRPRGERVYPTAFDQIRQLTELRKTLPWLADVPRNVCSQVLVDLDIAWQRCFSKISDSPPGWKRKGRDAISFIEPHHSQFYIKRGLLKFAKMRDIEIVQHIPLEGRQKNCTIKRDGDQWYASIMCEVEIRDPIPRTSPIIALDRGVVNAIADSDGNDPIPSPQFFKQALKRLARANRSVSRKQKGSKNQQKARVRVMRIHRKVRRQREHFVHNLTSKYTKSHGVIVVEKLQIGNMVKANSGLARGILDAGWGMLVSQLKYKQAWTGGSVVEVPAHYSSQTCSACGVVDAKSRVSQSLFRCTACGHTEHADTNAAKVLLSRANRSVLLGEGIAPEATLRAKKPVKLRTPRRKAKQEDLSVKTE